jgi:cell division protein FtsB
VLGGNVRWDRLGRILLLVVLAFILLLYIGPVRSYYSTWNEAKVRNAQLQQVEAENARLKARKQALSKPDTLLQEARKLGMLRPGEREFVIGRLPKD